MAAQKIVAPLADSDDVFSVSSPSLPPPSDDPSDGGQRESRRSSRVLSVPGPRYSLGAATSSQLLDSSGSSSSSASSKPDSFDKDYELEDSSNSDSEREEILEPNNVPFVTPNRPADTKRGLDLKTKANVVATSERLLGSPGKRCLITLALAVVQFCHIVGRSTRGDARLKLEYHWGMFARTLNLDTMWNIILLTPTKHFGMDHGVWVLIPLSKLATKILAHFLDPNINDDSAKTSDKQYFKEFCPDSETGWEYHFLNLSCQPDESIHRLILDSPDLSNADLEPKEYEKLSPPFRNFTVISHCHPFFVIAHAGKMLAKLKARYKVDTEAYTARWTFSGEIEKSVRAVTKIHDLWSTGPPDWFTDPARNPPSANDKSGRPPSSDQFPDRNKAGYFIPTKAPTPSRVSTRSNTSKVLLPRLTIAANKGKGKEKEVTTPPRHRSGFGSMGPPPAPTSSRGNASASSSNKRKPAFSPPSALQKQHREAPPTPKKPKRKPSPNLKVSESSSSDSPRPSQVSATGNPRRLPAPSASVPGLTTYGRRAPGQSRTSTSDRSQHSGQPKPWR
ncbi:hypothetical protein C8J56DRAFT_1046532 [Mycena floridula]|nr:hypothetical protein C8J56DRAFT_1046532 [Mycena floridula]